MSVAGPAKLVNVVMVAALSTPLRLRSLFEYLAVNWVDFIIGDDGIPYFGVDRAIVAAGYGGRFRGIKRNGQLRNIVSVDLQMGPESGGPENGKNVHIKISSENIHITGVLSQEMGQAAYTVILAHINMAIGYQRHIQGLDVDLQISTINVLLGNGFGGKFDLPFYRYGRMIESEYRTGLGGINHMSTVSVPKGKSTLDVAAYAAKLVLLCQIEPIYETPGLEITSSRVCNSIYTYKLDKRISLIDTAQKLLAMNYAVQYTNLKADKFMRAMIPVFQPGTTNYSIPFINRKGKEQINAHRFQVYKRGTVRQYSPTCYAEAIEAYKAFVQSLS